VQNSLVEKRLARFVDKDGQPVEPARWLYRLDVEQCEITEAGRVAMSESTSK
jgi:hypothetical protein